MSHWRVIAQRRNGQQRIIDEYMARDAAEKLRDTLKALSLFPAVFVEIEDDDIGRNFDFTAASSLS